MKTKKNIEKIKNLPKVKAALSRIESFLSGSQEINGQRLRLKERNWRWEVLIRIESWEKERSPHSQGNKSPFALESRRKYFPVAGGRKARKSFRLQKRKCLEKENMQKMTEIRCLSLTKQKIEIKRTTAV